MDRITKLCAYLKKCDTFADVGCDHGYCTHYMLENGLCNTATISDVSAKCLKKAETLLKNYIDNGKVFAVCCNGLEKISPATGQVLIAGMGGDEIVSILKNSFIPQTFCFQPMKNSRLLREFLLANGAQIICDEVFESGGKFYTVITGKNCGNSNIYGGVQLEYGYNLHSEDGKKYLLSELEKKRGYLKRPLSEETRKRIENEIHQIEEVINDES